jgi:hypothetical protein
MSIVGSEERHGPGDVLRAAQPAEGDGPLQRADQAVVAGADAAGVGDTASPTCPAILAGFGAG